jgi:hypothetical protein
MKPRRVKPYDPGHAQANAWFEAYHDLNMQRPYDPGGPIQAYPLVPDGRLYPIFLEYCQFWLLENSFVD